jgi:hypothetical protein
MLPVILRKKQPNGKFTNFAETKIKDENTP